MAGRWPGDKPLSEPMMVSLLMHICITQPQWVNLHGLTFMDLLINCICQHYLTFLAADRVSATVYVCLCSGTYYCCAVPSEGLGNYPSFLWLLSPNSKLEETGGHPEVNSSQRNRTMPTVPGKIYIIYMIHVCIAVPNLLSESLMNSTYAETMWHHVVNGPLNCCSILWIIIGHFE